MSHDISTLTDEQVTAIAQSLGWKEAPAAKLRRTLGLNGKSEKVQAAIQQELEKAEIQTRADEIIAEVEKGPEEVHFGMDEEAAAKYIQETFGLVPRMAKRAIMRGVNRDEYFGRGYVVRCKDLNPGITDDFDISIMAA